MFVRLDFITVDKAHEDVVLEGVISSEEKKQFLESSITCRVDSKEQSIQWIKRGISVEGETAFIVRMSIQDATGKLSFINGDETIVLRTGLFARLPDIRSSYVIKEGICFSISWNRQHLNIVTVDKSYIPSRDLLFLLSGLFSWRFDRVKYTFNRRNYGLNGLVKATVKSVAIVCETIIYIPLNYYIRHAARRAKRTLKRPLWLVSDRIIAAGDNGEALFRYIQEHGANADVRFVISRKSEDYRRMYTLGSVVDADSIAYKILFLCASKIISSQADIETINPFHRQFNHVVDMFKYDFIFLQHGVTRHDMSTWLNRYNRNINLLITSSLIEYESFLRLPYDYTADNILLSGMPRFDYLKNNPKRKIIIAPTYRKQLITHDTNKSGERPYDPTFQNSEYYKFYSQLLGHNRTRSLLDKYDMTVEFYLHPVFKSQIEDFASPGDRVIIKRFPYDYKLAFSEGAVLLSDYSSVVFDFAYMKKPIIYTQFDRDDFYQGHTYSESDFFSDEKQGFGPVTYNLDETLDALESILRQKNAMSPEYEKRVSEFFAYVDKNNSQRVYERILS